MGSEDTGQTREVLEKRRAELERRISSIQKTERAETSDGLTDNAHEWENAEIRSDELDEASSELRAVETALERLDRGEHGVCSRCGAEISPDRHELLPATTICAACAAQGG
jgi:RNA polymerase-binding transcription factor DksA